MISLGLSTFRLLPGDEDGKAWSYAVATYNITLLCQVNQPSSLFLRPLPNPHQEDYIVEPGSLKFLVEHGFDFQSQYSRGAPYLRGNDREEEETKKGVRNLFSILVASRKPMVLHNGLIDLVFLYHNFWCALPEKLGTFVADLAEMFPAGIYDTKYIADFVSRTQVPCPFEKVMGCSCEILSPSTSGKLLGVCVQKGAALKPGQSCSWQTPC